MIDSGFSGTLRNAHVIDPASGLNRITNVAISGGKIVAVGDAAGHEGGASIDLTGNYLTPGWIDIHVHAYGTLGFAEPDSIGIWQGVTSFVDAGGPGIGSMPEFNALYEGRTITSLYAGPYIRPMGIIGAQFIEGDIRSLTSFPVAEWLDFMKAHPGLVRYLKVAALGSYGAGPIRMGKGLAEILNLPLYGHIGEFQMQPEHPSAYELFRISDRGDIITHIYHNNGARILDREGKVLPVIRDAVRRGVLYDIGFGGFNFSWDVAEKAFAQDLRPNIVSSDLQQFNVIGPVYSLANVMGIFLHLGMSVAELVETVTWTPAKALSLTDTAGSLKPGQPADITVFKIESGEFSVADTYQQNRTVGQRITPVMAFKNGVRYDTDMTRCQDERNWMLQIAEDHVPAAASELSAAQRDFLAGLAETLANDQWRYDLQSLDLEKATELQRKFHRLARRQGLPLREALLAAFACFLDSPFTMQIGLFLLHLEHDFAIARLRAVVGDRSLAA